MSAPGSVVRWKNATLIPTIKPAPARTISTVRQICARAAWFTSLGDRWTSAGVYPGWRPRPHQPRSTWSEGDRGPATPGGRLAQIGGDPLSSSIRAMTGDPSRPSSAEWRRVLPTILGVFVATRLIVIFVAAVIQFTLADAPAKDLPDQRPILSALASSDAVYYLAIAAEGYHAQPVSTVYHDWAFFPLYPAAV